MTWPVHPAAELFPMLADDELCGLADDIAANGLHQPLTLYREDGQVLLLDGRNRLAACERAGVKVRTQTYAGDDPIGYVVSENVKRRHLTTGQRAALANDVLALYEAEAKQRRDAAPTTANRAKVKGKQSVGRSAHTSTAPQRARDGAAKTTGTSGRAVERFKRVAEAAPDLAEKVRAGEIALDRAERIVRDREAEKRKVAEARAAALRRIADVLAGFGTQVPETARAFAVIALAGATIRRTGNMSFTLQDGFEADLSVSFADAGGNPATVESVTWESSDEAVVTVVNQGEGSALVTAVGVGESLITMTADARFGDDVSMISGTLDINVVAGEATDATISASAPRPAGGARPPTPTPADGAPPAPADMLQ